MCTAIIYDGSYCKKQCTSKLCEHHKNVHDLLVYGRSKQDTVSYGRGYHLLKALGRPNFNLYSSSYIAAILVTIYHELCLRTIVFNSMFPAILSDEGHIMWNAYLNNLIDDGLKTINMRVLQQDLKHKVSIKDSKLNEKFWVYEDRHHAVYDERALSRYILNDALKRDRVKGKYWEDYDKDLFTPKSLWIHTIGCKKILSSKIWEYEDYDYAKLYYTCLDYEELLSPS